MSLPVLGDLRITRFGPREKPSSEKERGKLIEFWVCLLLLGRKPKPNLTQEVWLITKYDKN